MRLTPEESRRCLVVSEQDLEAVTNDNIERIRARGFGTRHHELIEGTVVGAAPFFNSANQVAG
jgi:DNA-binding IclR family transcriptional regulator